MSESRALEFVTVTEVRESSAPGFDEFVAAEGEALLRLAYLLTTETKPAVTVLEDALARTYGAWPRLAATGRPEDYVRRVLVQEATDSHRSRRTTSRTTAEPEATGADDDLVAALRALPSDERAATVLRHCLDLSEMETAATLGCTVGAVRRQTMRALTRLREHLPAVSPGSRHGSAGLVELMRHLQSALRALPDRLELRPAPDLLRNVRRTHAKRTLRRRAAVMIAASFVIVVMVILIQVNGGGSGGSEVTTDSVSRAAAAVVALR